MRKIRRKIINSGTSKSDSYSKAIGTDSPGIERIRPSRAPPGQPISEESSSEPADDRQLLDYYLTKRKSEYSSPCDVSHMSPFVFLD